MNVSQIVPFKLVNLYYYVNFTAKLKTNKQTGRHLNIREKKRERERVSCIQGIPEAALSQDGDVELLMQKHGYTG